MTLSLGRVSWCLYGGLSLSGSHSWGHTQKALLQNYRNRHLFPFSSFLIPLLKLNSLTHLEFISGYVWGRKKIQLNIILLKNQLSLQPSVSTPCSLAFLSLWCSKYCSIWPCFSKCVSAVPMPFIWGWCLYTLLSFTTASASSHGSAPFLSQRPSFQSREPTVEHCGHPPFTSAPGAGDRSTPVS